MDVDYEKARNILRVPTVKIESLVEVDPAPLKDFLKYLGINVKRSRADIVILIVDSFLTSQYVDKIICEYVRRGISCLPVQPGLTTLIGPYLEPNGACWACFKKGLHRHNAAPQTLQRILQTKASITTASSYPTLTIHRCLEFAGKVLLNYLLQTTAASPRDHHLYSLNHVTAKEQRHFIVPWIYCSECTMKHRQVAPASAPALNLDQTLEAIDALASFETLEENLITLKKITSTYTGVLRTLSLVSTPENERGLYRAVSRHPIFNMLPGEYKRQTDAQRSTL